MGKHKYIETPEKWLPIEGYEGYEVSNFGNIRSYRKRGSKDAMYDEPKRVNPLLLKTHCKEYFKYHLVKDGKQKSEYIHRLVAKAFIPNPESKSQVHHIDNDGLNNHIDNLQWVTNSENQIERDDVERPSGYIYVYKNRDKWRAANIKLGFDRCFNTRKVAVAFSMQYY